MNFELNQKIEIKEKNTKKILIDKNCEMEVILEVNKNDDIDYLEFSLNFLKGSK